MAFVQCCDSFFNTGCHGYSHVTGQFFARVKNLSGQQLCFRGTVQYSCIVHTERISNICQWFLCFSGTNQKPERRRPFGTGLVRHCPQGLFSPFFAFLRAMFFRPFKLSLAPFICPWVSEDGADFIFTKSKIALSQHRRPKLTLRVHVN